MFKFIDNIKNSKLKKSEQKFGLYDKHPIFQVHWIFTHVDQLSNCGHFNAQHIVSENKVENRCVVVINLNKKNSEEIILHSLNHEALHLAILNCINSSDLFIEKVIDYWMMKEKIVCANYSSNNYIEKVI